MNDVATQSGGSTALAALQSLKTGLANVRQTIPTAGGDPILKFSKGDWLYGQDEVEVEKGSQWAVNPLSIMHGYIAWKDRPEGSTEPAERLGEVMVPMTQMKPTEDKLPPLPADKPGTWSDQVMMQMKCLNGEDKDLQTRTYFTSVGGLSAAAKLIDAIIAQLGTGTDAVVPVIELEADSYQHKVYKKTYVPVLKIVGWMTMDGPDAAAPSPAAASPAAAPATGADQAAATAGDEAGEADAGATASATAAPAPSGRRRRAA